MDKKNGSNERQREAKGRVDCRRTVRFLLLPPSILPILTPEGPLALSITFFFWIRTGQESRFSDALFFTFNTTCIEPCGTRSIHLFSYFSLPAGIPAQYCDFVSLNFTFSPSKNGTTTLYHSGALKYEYKSILLIPENIQKEFSQKIISLYG